MLSSSIRNLFVPGKRADPRQGVFRDVCADE